MAMVFGNHSRVATMTSIYEKHETQRWCKYRYDLAAKGDCLGLEVLRIISLLALYLG